MEKAAKVAALRVRLRTDSEYGIWTGGATAGEMDDLKATSLLGGLRFWTAALLRANGEKTCSNAHSCQYDPKQQDQPCALCRIFGCTGLSRAFSLTVDSAGQNGAQTMSFSKGNKGKVELLRHKYTDAKGKIRIPTYYLTQGYCGSLDLALTLRRPQLGSGAYAIPAVIPTALYLMITYGTLGAYDQYGCGLVDFAAPEDKTSLRQLCQTQAKANPAPEGTSLRDFFFFKGKISYPHRLAMGEIRYRIRNALRQGCSAELRHWFCGNIKGKAYGTNYAFTVKPNGALYGWGFYPRSGPAAIFPENRDTVLNAMIDVLRQKDMAGQSLVWRECNSPRDTQKKQPWPEFYTSLLQGDWRDA